MEKTLLVEGCIWAASYEYRLYDFSNSMQLPLPALSEPFEMELSADESKISINDKGNPLFEEFALFLKETGEGLWAAHERLGYAKVNALRGDPSLWTSKLKSSLEFLPNGERVKCTFE